MDRLRAERSPEGRGLTRERAERMPGAVGDTGLAGVERDIGVLNRTVGAMVAITVAVFGQLFTLNGTVTRLDERLPSFGERLGQVETRSTGVEGRPGPTP